VPGFVGASVAMVGLALSALFHLAYPGYVALFLALVALIALTGGSIQTIGADVAPPEARGMFLGLWSFTAQSGLTLSPLVFALLSDRVNYAAAFLFIAVSSVVVAFLLIRYVPETRRAQL